jgi:hypothetical protein
MRTDCCNELILEPQSRQVGSQMVAILNEQTREFGQEQENVEANESVSWRVVM